MPGACLCFPEVHNPHGHARVVPASVKSVFDQATDGKEFMNATDLAGFISRVQGNASVDEVQAANIISKCVSAASSHHHLFGSHGSKGGMNTQLDLHGFYSYLLENEDNYAEANLSKPWHDMTGPLSHYYMYTSHNSYLTGNQLTSKSSTSPIVKALRNGCRVIELDCWERRGKIVVLHGNTLTKSVGFADCVKAIKEFAFTASDYPVIITIENHLSVDMQQQAAQILVETLGDLLFVPPSEESPPKIFRSPEELRGKIIISDKPPGENVEEQVQEDPHAAAQVLPDVIGSPPEDEGHRRVAAGKKKTKATNYTVQKAAAAMAAITRKPDPAEEQQKLAGEFGRLLYILCEKPSEMKDAVDNQNMLVSGEAAIMANLSEPQLKKFVDKNAGSLIEYTRINLGRMYPYGLRFDSSNADPMIAWSHGFQLAAMNMQGQNRASWVADALFKGNGGCGYVRKPDIFLNESSPDLENMGTLPPKFILKMRVLIATDWHKRFDWFKKPDFYVKIALHGMPADRAKYKTTIHKGSREPTWDDETFEFTLRVPEIAILRLEAWEEDKFRRNDFAGQACMALRLLQPGIRNIPLKGRDGIPNGAKVLCEFTLEPQNDFSWS
eukprot:TRINITY_DN552_c0_g1_i1.p1 TRINITY_DN552_c0_g1~~TRINITY_DN552_c0_g1_i1.p1  ORF type:complete len:612 (-),score=114.70 TRINITY_DN552_c0_g1_i1:269-2104(-)